MLVLIVREEGTLVDINSDGIEEIQQLSSFAGLDIFLKKGTHVAKSIDGLTFGGAVKLVNDDFVSLLADYEFIHAMPTRKLFVLQ